MYYWSQIFQVNESNTLFKFDNVALRYWEIQFEGTGSDDFDDTYDFQLGELLSLY